MFNLSISLDLYQIIIVMRNVQFTNVIKLINVPMSLEAKISACSFYAYKLIMMIFMWERIIEYYCTLSVSYVICQCHDLSLSFISVISQCHVPVSCSRAPQWHTSVQTQRAKMYYNYSVIILLLTLWISYFVRFLHKMGKQNIMSKIIYHQF